MPNLLQNVFDESNRVAPSSLGFETRTRTLVRSLIWRASGIVLAVLLTIYFTGNARLGIELGVSYNAIRLIAHYLHDRYWAHVRWGLNP